jgi:hypothetical protein
MIEELEEGGKGYQIALPVESYRPVGQEDVDYRFRELGYRGKYQFPLVETLAYCASHHQEGFHARSGLIPDFVIPREDFEDEEPYQKSVRYHDNIRTFIDTLDFGIYTGSTPLEKAVSVLYTFLKEDEKNGKENGGEGEMMPFFDQPKSAMEKAKSQVEQKLIERLEANPSVADITINPEGWPIERLIYDIKPAHRELMKGIEDVKSRSAMRFFKKPGTYVSERMKSHSQVSVLRPMSQLAKPDFKLRFAKKELYVKVKRSSAKQVIIIAIDNSGSMNQKEKKMRVSAYLINTLDSVASGDGVAYICWFESSIDKEKIIKVSNKEEAIAFYETGNIGSFDMGGTNVMNVITVIAQCIEEGRFGEHELKDLHKPNLIIVNDGNDAVDPNYVSPLVTHAVVLGLDNYDLKKVVESSGGEYQRYL